ncbi:hypothetical protein AQ490_05310 [Wenjunlia vitaminophila]|uniref:Malonyl-CoA:ACP transacylase (MAT) domain-containing protein n=1 Tax=Wenjunlia vitaminophila TaxID=76728 RepID=A0A0T6LPJ8_WENVI|nr:acyltransferase domain-containing protein [Wenjunlia vitaminophila]KRV47791.1 hypothetical protein AQ490_05310 [Wenjunlia vitaminophila]
MSAAALRPGSPVAFLFTGQGAQYPGMTARLYRESPTYRRHLDEASEALLPYTGESVSTLLLTGDARVHLTGFTQPALFAVGYALAQTVLEQEVRPGAVLGYSNGEYAAACVSGALSLADAARLVALRGSMMQGLPVGGGMLKVLAGRAEVQRLVDAERTVGIGGVNGPGEIVLSGELAALARIGGALRERGLTVVPVQVSHGFHSPLMEPVVTGFARGAIRVGGRVPRLAFYSTVRGRRLVGEPLDGPYWTEHISAPVRFSEAAAAMVRDGYGHLVEIGPRPALTRLVSRLGVAEQVRSCGNPVHDAESGVAELDRLVSEVLQRTGEPLAPLGDQVREPQAV